MTIYCKETKDVPKTDHYAIVMKLDEIHPSHVMSEWRSTIVTLVETPRFGSIRKCKECGAEEAKTAAGHGMHDELREPCRN